MSSQTILEDLSSVYFCCFRKFQLEKHEKSFEISQKSKGIHEYSADFKSFQDKEKVSSFQKAIILVPLTFLQARNHKFPNLKRLFTEKELNKQIKMSQENSFCQI
jgi:hypothetical protein